MKRFFLRVLSLTLFTLAAMVGRAQTPEEKLYWDARSWLDLDSGAQFMDHLERLRGSKPESPRKACLVRILDGLLLHANGENAAAVTALGRAEAEARKLYGAYSPVHMDALARWSYARGDNGELQAEMDTMRVIEAIYARDPAKNQLEIAECLNVIGMNYGKEQGDDLSQMRLQQRGLELVLSYTPKDRLDSLKALKQEWTLRNSLAVAFTDAGDYENARLSALGCKRILAKLAPGHPYTSIADQVLGRSYWYLNGDLDLCMAYMDSALARLPPGSPPWFSYTAYKAECLLQGGRTHEALVLTTAAMPMVSDAAFAEGGIGESSYKLMLLHGHALLRNGQAREAAAVVGRARAHLRAIRVSAGAVAMKLTELDLLSRDALGGYASADRLVDSVLAKYGKLWEGDRSGTAYNKDYVRTCARFGEHMLSRTRGAATTQERKAALAHAVPLLEGVVGMELANRSVYFTDGAADHIARGMLDVTALLLEAYAAARMDAPELAPFESIARALSADKSRLLEHDTQSEALFEATLALPEETRRKTLRAGVTRAFNDYLNAPMPTTSDALLNARTTYAVELDALRGKYPSLRVSASAGPPCDLSAECARTGGLLLDYYLGDSALFTLRTDARGQAFFRRSVPAGFRAGIALYRGEALDPRTWSEGRMPSAEVLALPAAWKALLLDGIAATGAPVPTLLVVPHHELGLINFELLPALGDPAKYLIEETEVRYLLSANMLCQDDAPAAHGPLRLAGFASSEFQVSADMDADLQAYAARGGAGNLQGTEAETRAVTDLYGGTYYTHATAEGFLRDAPGYDVLHVGTHGFAHQDGSGNAYLLFEGDHQWADRVTRARISGLRLPCELAVLSACNTGVGALRGGEGTASLSRSFFQAGARSVVSSLWKVPDEGTSGIMTAFYGYMRDGMPRGAALRRAKLDHLMRYRTGVERMPWFWSGFVLTGADGPLPAVGSSSSGARWWWVAIFVALLLGYFAFKRRRSSTAS